MTSSVLIRGVGLSSRAHVPQNIRNQHKCTCRLSNSTFVEQLSRHSRRQAQRRHRDTPIHTTATADARENKISNNKQSSSDHHPSLSEVEKGIANLIGGCENTTVTIQKGPSHPFLQTYWGHATAACFGWLVLFFASKTILKTARNIFGLGKRAINNKITDDKVQKMQKELLEEKEARRSRDVTAGLPVVPEVVEVEATVQVVDESQPGQKEAELDMETSWGEDLSPTTAPPPPLDDPDLWREEGGVLYVIRTIKIEAEGYLRMDMAPPGYTGKRLFHLIAFRERSDAQNMCYMLQGQQYDIKAMFRPEPKLAQEVLPLEHLDGGTGITVLKKAQIDLSPRRKIGEVLKEIASIGGTKYLADFLSAEIDMRQP